MSMTRWTCPGRFHRLCELLVMGPYSKRRFGCPDGDTLKAHPKGTRQVDQVDGVSARGGSYVM